MLYFVDEVSLMAALLFFFWLNLINLGVFFSLNFLSPKVAFLIRTLDFLTLFFTSSMISKPMKFYSYILFPLPIFISAFQIGAFGCFFFTVFALFIINLTYFFTQSPRFFDASLYSSPLPSFLLVLSSGVAMALFSLFEREYTKKEEKIKELEVKAERFVALDKIIGADKHFESEAEITKFILSKLGHHLKATLYYLKKRENRLEIVASGKEREEKFVGLPVPEQNWIYRSFNSRSSGFYPPPSEPIKPGLDEPFRNSFLLFSPVLDEREIIGALLAVREFGKAPFGLEEMEFVGIASHHFRALIKEAQVRESLKKSVNELSAIAKIAEASISNLSLDELLKVSLEAAAKVLHAFSGSLFLVKNSHLQLAKTYNLKIKPYLLSSEKERGSEIIQLVSREKKYLHLVNPLPPKFKGLHPEITDSLVLPLLIKEELVGILCLNNQTPRHYSKEEIKTALTIANELALAIKSVFLYQETLEKSLTDQLTGLRNHAYFWERLEEEIKRASRANNPLSILILDLDNFKVLNDTYGHLKGDEILKEVGKILKETLRKSDIPARYGGDEFAVIMPETPVENSVRLAKRLTSRVNQLKYGNLYLTLSIGIASYPEHGRNAAELIEQADLALYSIKRQGKGGIKTARGIN